VLKHGENTGEAEYEATDSDVECWIHVDVSYRRYAFGVGDRVFEFSAHGGAGNSRSFPVRVQKKTPI